MTALSSKIELVTLFEMAESDIYHLIKQRLFDRRPNYLSFRRLTEKKARTTSAVKYYRVGFCYK